MHAVESRTFATPSSVQTHDIHTLTHTERDRQDSRTAHTPHVTADALLVATLLSSVLTCMPCDLKHLDFPLVPYHTVLHSACSRSRLIGPIIHANLRIRQKHILDEFGRVKR